MKSKRVQAVFIVCAGLAATGASADVFQWDWSAAADGTRGLNMRGGEFESVHAEYNSSDNRFLWEVVFSDQITDGYTLAVNNGPNPKGHAGELALIYFDATHPDVRVSAYAYNGQNTLLTYRDGSPQAGDQDPDQIFGFNHSSILRASSEDIGAKRKMTLEIDAGVINAHSPAYPGPGGSAEWTGIAFDEMLGLWMHPLTELTTGYDQDESLTAWSGSQGWFDASSLKAASVPAPHTLAIFGLGGLAACRRRRQ